MASTTFIDNTTVIYASWLNDVNTGIYSTLPALLTSDALKAPLLSPSFTTPTLGVATATSINKNSFTTPASGCTWTMADGKTLTVSNTMTLAGTDGATLNIGAGGTLGSGAYTVTGTNTGDQLVFKTISVSGQSNIVADTTSDTLTIAAGTGITLTTDSTTDTLTVASSLTMALLSSATVSSAVANIDFLNVFTSSYDKYIIEVQNVELSAASNLLLGIAKSGSVDTSSVYVTQLGHASGTGSLSAGPVVITPSGMAGATAARAHFTIEIRNANDAGSSKGIGVRGIYLTATANFTAQSSEGAYTGSGPISGFRLTVTSGTFTAGTVRVYGIKNT